MSTNITGVTMPRPTVDPNIAAGGSFEMGGQITAAGGGGWAESGDMYFEWDQGIGSWATIGGSGDLYTEDTNPILGLQTATEQIITVKNDGTAGGFQVRVKLIEDDLTEWTTAAVNVTVAQAGETVQIASAGLSQVGGSVNVNAKTNLSVGPAVLSQVGQALITNLKTRIAIGQASIFQNAQALIVNAKEKVVIGQASLSLLGQVLTVLAAEIISIGTCIVSQVGQSVGVNMKTQIEVAGANISQGGQALYINATERIYIDPATPAMLGRSLIVHASGAGSGRRKKGLSTFGQEQTIE